MPKRELRRRSDCPISYALDLFGDKWTLLIIRDMMFKRKRRYGKFVESEEKIATNILADRLAKLESEGLVTKQADPENGRQFIYALTPKAFDLAPLLIEMILWSAKHHPHTAADRAFIRKAKVNREQLVKDVISSIQR
ncbi:MAG: winged helix-turn-helix transcriptional regulator [Terriglobales bacterium]